MQKHKEKNVAFDAKVNPKKFWNYVGSKMKVNLSLEYLSCISSVTSNDCEKAEALLNHFSSVFTLEPDGDAPLPPDQHVSSPLDSMVIILLKN